MPDASASPQFEASVRAAIVGRLPQPDDSTIANLRSDLVARAKSRHHTRPSQRFRLAFVLGMVVVLISMGLFAASPQAAAAMRHWLGFIPGLGLVDQSAPWQMLTEPVSQSKNSVVLTVETATADSNRTVVLIQVEGMVSPLGAPSVGGQEACLGSPELLVDGTPMPGLGQRQEVWDSGYRYRLVFPPMPAGEAAAELHIPCLIQVVPGAWPRDWVIPLAFRAGEGQPVEPAYQPRLALQGKPETPTAGVTTGTTSPQYTSVTPSPSLVRAFGISPNLEGVVQPPDGLLLFGSITWTEHSIVDYGVMPLEVTLSDANGTDIPIEPAASDDLPLPGSRRTAWAFRAMGSDFQEPLTLSFNSFLVDLEAEAAFDLELGPDPKSGQTWPVDRHISLGPYDVRIISARLAPGDSGGSILELTLDSESGVVRALVYDPDHPENSQGGGGVMVAGQQFVVRVSYPDGIPGSSVHLSIGRISVLVDEISSITWSEPAP